jgi:TonB-dependent receptor
MSRVISDQKRSKLRNGLLIGVAVYATIGTSTQALAQTTTAPADSIASPEYADADIVVTGSPIRDSLTRSLEIQRRSDNIVNAITADTAGRFPDQTVAAALSRLPGIGVQRDQGQERYVQVRGAPTRWTVVSFDGINVLGAEERIFRFDSVPAVLISTVELNKTLLPDMPAEALAGRVNIKTYSALDNRGFHGLLDGGYGFVDLGDGPQEQIAGRLSWANDMFGIVLAGSHFKFEQQTDNAEPRYDAIGLNNLRNAKYIIERETNSLSGKLEFAPAKGHRISASSLYTEFLDHEQRNQYTLQFASGTGTRTKSAGSKNSTSINRLHGEHDFAPWRVGWDLAYVETESATFLPIINQSAANRALRPSVTYTSGEYGLPVISLFETVQTGPTTFSAGAPRTSLNQQAFDTETLTLFTGGSKTKSYTVKLDIARDWTSFGAEATIRIGGQYDDRTSKDPGATALLRPNGQAGTLSLRPVAAQLGVPWTPLTLVTGRRFDEDLNRGYTANYINNPAMRDQLDALLAAAEAANAAGGTFPVPRKNPALANTVNERIAAGYVSNIWHWDRFSLVAGLRVENTKITSEGAAATGGVLQPITIESDNTLIFPSLHFNLDLTERLKLRAAFVSGAARPSFVDQRATVTIADAAGLQFVAGGNPGLKPERALGGDASVEWYFAPGALLSASGFYRDVKDVLFDSTSTVGDDRFNFNGIDRSAYTYTTTLNGESGKLYGVEFAYNHPFTFLPGALSGFGFQGSVAFVDGSFRTPDGREVAFPGTSKRITNLSLFYEKYGFSARIGYQHRTDWLDDISIDATRDLFWDATERVDLSFRYEVVRNFTLYADVINLTNEPGIRYEGDESRPYEVEMFGRRFLFGVRATF